MIFSAVLSDAAESARLLCQASGTDAICEALLSGAALVCEARRGFLIFHGDRRCLYIADFRDTAHGCVWGFWPADTPLPDADRIRVSAPSSAVASPLEDVPWQWSLSWASAEWLTLPLPACDNRVVTLHLHIPPGRDLRESDAGVCVAEPLLHLAATLLQAVSLSEDAQRLETERHESELALRDVEAFMAEAQRISRTGSWAWDPTDPSVSEWSAQTYAMLGYDASVTAASHEANLARVHPDDRARYAEQLQTTAASGQDLDVEHRYLLPDGTLRQVRTRGRRVSATLYIGTSNDISERRATEAAVRKAHAELAAASRLTTLGELAASISHELNQPFTAVVANAAAGRRWLDRDVSDISRAKRSLDSLLEDARRAQSVIGSLRALARKSEPERRPMDIDEAVTEIAILSRSKLTVEGVELALDLRAGGSAVLADRVQIQQVILTLIMTCLESVGTRPDPPRRVSIATHWEGAEKLVMAIEGSCPVMDPPAMDAPLDLLDPADSGHLLGLAVCRSIIEAHGGSLRVVDGTVPQGRFEVVLPGTDVEP